MHKSLNDNTKPNLLVWAAERMPISRFRCKRVKNVKQPVISDDLFIRDCDINFDDCTIFHIM